MTPAQTMSLRRGQPVRVLSEAGDWDGYALSTSQDGERVIVSGGPQSGHLATIHREGIIVRCDAAEVASTPLLRATRAPVEVDGLSASYRWAR